MVTPAIGVALLFIAVATKVLVVARGSLSTAEEIVSVSSQWTIVSGTLLIFFPVLIVSINLVAQLVLTISLLDHLQHRPMTRWAEEKLALGVAAFVISLGLILVITPLLDLGEVAAYLLTNAGWVWTFQRNEADKKTRQPPNSVRRLYWGLFATILGQACILLAISIPWLAPQQIILTTGHTHKAFTAYILQDSDGEITLLLDANRTIMPVPQRSIRREQLCRLSDKDLTQGESLFQWLGATSGPKLPKCPTAAH